MKTVLIYRSDLLPLSETFIRAQAGALQHYRPQFIGLREATPSLLGPEDSVLCGSRSLLPKTLQRLAYEEFGVQPVLHSSGLLRRLRSLQPALMHAHFATDAIAAIPLAKALGVPLMITLHGYDVTMQRHYRNSLRNWHREKQFRQLWSEASLFLCVSEFIRGKAIAAGFPAEKLKVHHIGIDTTIFEVPDDHADSEHVVFVGRLTEKKGCSFLIRAMQEVQKVHPNATLMIVGDGPLRAQLEELAQELKVRCQFWGRQSHDQVKRHISNAKVFVLPSVTAANGDSEGLGMVQLEAQAMGIPVVGTRHGGIPEGIVDGHAGLLSEERDVRGLACNILRVLEDEHLRADVGRRGAQLIRKRFDLHRQTAQLEIIYDDVITARTKQDKAAA